MAGWYGLRGRVSQAGGVLVSIDKEGKRMDIAPGTFATWFCSHRFAKPGRCYRHTVRVLDVRKKTARIEACRYDGTRVRRFVKINKLTPGAYWFD